MTNHTVYILQCSDKTLYSGCTTNIDKRLHEHNHTKAGAKYTRARRPVKLVYSETQKNHSTAMRREAEIKRMSRDEKFELIRTS